MKLYWQSDCGRYKIYNSAAGEIVPDDLPPIDALVTDVPYELKAIQRKPDGTADYHAAGKGFMGHAWDGTGVSFKVETWKAIMDKMKPGAHGLVFGGCRTFHRIAVAAEDAGFDLRDTLMWVTGQGFPKGSNIAWDVHKKACVECGVMEEYAYDFKKPYTSGNEKEEVNSEGVKQDSKHCVRFVRGTYLQEEIYACSECGQVLQPFMPEQGLQAYREAWEKSKTIWPEQSGVERWSDLEASKGELSRCKICKMSHGTVADGAKGWIHYGTPFSDGKIPWATLNKDGSCSSYRPQSIQQYNPKSNAFFIERRAQEIRGFNTNLKPGYEPILMLRKPVDGTIAENVIKHGVGGINIGACRVGEESVSTHSRGGNGAFPKRPTETSAEESGRIKDQSEDLDIHSKRNGRWPANFLHDGSEDVLDCFPDAGGQQGDLVGHNKDSVSPNGIYGSMGPKSDAIKRVDESKSAARFFYCAKVSKKERNEGMGDSKNNHVTVKPQELMKFCNRLICPPGGIILDPFLGSGSTMVAAVKQGFSCIGVDISEEYCEIAKRRVEHALNNLKGESDEKSKISSTKQSPVQPDNTVQPELPLL